MAVAASRDKRAASTSCQVPADFRDGVGGYVSDPRRVALISCCSSSSSLFS